MGSLEILGLTVDTNRVETLEGTFDVAANSCDITLAAYVDGTSDNRLSVEIHYEFTAQEGLASLTTLATTLWGDDAAVYVSQSGIRPIRVTYTLGRFDTFESVDEVVLLTTQAIVLPPKVEMSEPEQGKRLVKIAGTKHTTEVTKVLAMAEMLTPGGVTCLRLWGHGGGRIIIFAAHERHEAERVRDYIRADSLREMIAQNQHVDGGRGWLYRADTGQALSSKWMPTQTEMEVGLNRLFAGYWRV